MVKRVKRKFGNDDESANTPEGGVVNPAVAVEADGGEETTIADVVSEALRAVEDDEDQSDESSSEDDDEGQHNTPPASGMTSSRGSSSALPTTSSLAALRPHVTLSFGTKEPIPLRNIFDYMAPVSDEPSVPSLAMFWKGGRRNLEAKLEFYDLQDISERVADVEGEQDGAATREGSVELVS